ncbi:hypothetical protein F0562_001396 [Nyssa sinensis]|uniref:Receptor-like serine/threonine-protein kinase n=1 Tax=Nyssa sinensis TaxID=561372 RepID=A0A5J5C3P5_9ASTE|nr:hypothetical protein F0562_001396 [Nyssa sinensis]
MAFAIPSYPIYFMLFFLLPFSTTAQTYRNITLGSSLTARNDNSSWASPSGDFAFGFQEIETGGFLLAIWFNKIPEKTIIWSANRNNLVQSGSIIQLTADGMVVLNDNKGQQIWSADPGGVSYAAMLDTGNFVVASNDSATLWQSFDYPTDTILPTQTLQRDQKLVACLSERDYSTGRFRFTLQRDGDLVLYTTDFPMDTVSKAYWASNTVNSGYQVIFNQSGHIYLITMNETIVSPILSNPAPASNFYMRAILEYDGVFRQYVYPKSAGSSTGGWPMAWSPLSSSLPENLCMTLMEEVGSGPCGFNSHCTLGDNDRPNCKCLPGYTLLDPSNKANGCKPDFVPQNCGEGPKETDLFDFREISNTDWALSDYKHFEKVTEDYCRESCLGDCFCAAAHFRDENCWKKRMPLTNGRTDPRVVGKGLIKIRKDNSTTQSTGGSPENSDKPPQQKDQPQEKKDQSGLILTGSVLLGSSMFLNLLLLLVTLLFLIKKKSKTLQPCSTMLGLNLRSFTYKELEEATDGFKEELGRGSFGTVYKGIIEYEKGNFVAVKKLEKLEKRAEQEFNTEVSAIGRTNHKNLVQLLGFCSEGEHRLLVYEFMCNGCLASILFGDSRLRWEKRIQIGFGTARGLYYLHEECSTQMIHCDIKPQNILLDDSFTARISDFGLAKLLKADQTQTTTAVRGTKGKNFEQDADNETQMGLADWAYDCYREGKLHLIVENDEEAMGDMKRLEKFVMIAIWCIQEDPSLRPTMKKVTQMLEGSC